MDEPKNRTLIYRMVHYKNLDSLLTYGIHCLNHINKVPNYINIGAKNLISKRDTYTVPIYPHGVLNDYIPFYFSPRSPMLFAIKSNPQEYEVEQSDIIYLVSSVEKIEEYKLDYIFNDGHFNFAFTKFYNKKEDLNKLDWNTINAKFWANTQDDNDKERRRQAEFLVYKNIPFDCIGAIISYNEVVQKHVATMLLKHNKKLYNEVKTNYYF